MIKTIIGTLAQVLNELSCKFNKRLYLGQLFKIENEKFVVSSLSFLEDGRVTITLLKK